MPLLIDGYNLLHATGLFGRGQGPGGFERSRQALLDFLAATLDESERNRTTIVFDSVDAPPGLPARWNQAGIEVRFARGYASADELLEELIAADHAPRRLVVVSSDHRVQRAARRRRAVPMDSDHWHVAMLERRAARSSPEQGKSPGPAAAATPAEMEFWLAEFAVDDKSLEVDPFVPRRKPLVTPGTVVPNTPSSRSADRRRAAAKRAAPPADVDRKAHWHEVWGDIFPPGYGDDLEDEA